MDGSNEGWLTILCRMGTALLALDDFKIPGKSASTVLLINGFGRGRNEAWRAWVRHLVRDYRVLQTSTAAGFGSRTDSDGFPPGRSR